MRKLLTIQSSFKYDGSIAERDTVKIAVHSAGYEVLQFTAKQEIVSFANRGRQLTADIANMPTMNGLVTPPSLTWEPALGKVDMGSLVKFVRRYGGGGYGGYGGYGNAGYVSGKPDDTVEIDPVGFSGFQFILRWAWRGDEGAIALIAGDEKNADQFFQAKVGNNYANWNMQDNDGNTAQRIEKNELGHPMLITDGQNLNALRVLLHLPPISAGVLVRAAGVEIVATSIWDFARLNFLRDHLSGRTRVCENPNCVTPYFVFGRKRQIYCSHDCAMAAASRNYRKKVKELIKREKAKGQW